LARLVFVLFGEVLQCLASGWYAQSKALDLKSLSGVVATMLLTVYALYITSSSPAG
jgi:hypothetical protein